jgi:alanine racemase
MSNELTARAWLEVDTGALRANFEALRRTVGADCALIAMVKADGYGVGAERVTRVLEPLGPWGYGVATAAEGHALRGFGVRRPIIVFSPLPAGAVDQAAAAGLTATISDIPALERWAAATERHGPLDCHIEIDSGMGRAGFDWRETGAWGSRVQAMTDGALRWTGVYTHFHGADAPDAGATGGQWQRFRDALSALPVSVENLMVHACNSASALRFPECRADAVRPGIFLYGGHPAPDLPAGAVPAPAPVVGALAKVVLVRDAPPGSTVGYGATHVARAWERWATVGVGYGDGVPRILGNRGTALVRGTRARLIGRISMDMLVVDITGIPDVVAGDVVTLIGRDGDEELSLEDFAAGAEKINYEILTGFTPRMPRVER